MRPSRRQLLGTLGVGAAAAALGAGAVARSWWKQDPEAPLRNLSSSEAAFIRALADAAFPATATRPADGEDLRLDRAMDEVLEALPELPRDQLRLLFHALDAWPRPAHLRSFQALDLSARQVQIASWLDHPLAEVRGAASGVLVLLGMAWSAHPSIAPTFAPLFGCGYG